MKTPPPEVVEAARVVERWADNNLCSDFRIGKIKYIAPVGYGCGGDPLADDFTNDWCTDYHCAGDCGLRGHGTQVGAKWREDSRLETWFPLTAEKLAPLTRQQIDDVMTQHYPLSSLLREEVDAFEACVRDIERLHGIGA